jgi:DNA-binding cell septation regulator SpoVG
VSAPIEGQNGVWVIMPTTRNPVEASGQFTTEVKNLNERTYFRNQPISSGAPVRLSNAIIEKADIDDLRQGS